MSGSGGEPRKSDTAGSGDAGKAIRFMALKAAVFILVPLVAAIVAVLVMLK
ncbi:MAG: phosphoribosylformylglycinamidine synthase-associated small membrane protein [Hyphomicrobiaceae bacterium]